MAIKIKLFIDDGGGVILDYYDTSMGRSFSRTFSINDMVGNSLKTWAITVRRFILGIV